jgi:transglutaminase-like putative cysteine protease
MATFFIKHTTRYTYSNPVFDCANLIRLHPINDAFQKVVSHCISVTNDTFIETFIDFYQNRFGTFMIREPHDELSIISEIEVVTKRKMFPDDSEDVKLQWETLKKFQDEIALQDFLKYTRFSGTPEIERLLQDINRNAVSPYKAVMELCTYIYTSFKYEAGITDVHSSLDEVWHLKSGVCQDFTNVLLQVIRMLGIPARYVSGYICPSDHATRGEGATHAWVEAYLPFYGWLGLDPTNNIIANEHHVRLAVGRNYNDCSPVKGVYKGKVEADLFVKVEVSNTSSSENNAVQQSAFSSFPPGNSYQTHLESTQQQQQ